MKHQILQQARRYGTLASVKIISKEVTVEINTNIMSLPYISEELKTGSEQVLRYATPEATKDYKFTPYYRRLVGRELRIYCKKID